MPKSQNNVYNICGQLFKMFKHSFCAPEPVINYKNIKFMVTKKPQLSFQESVTSVKYIFRSV